MSVVLINVCPADKSLSCLSCRTISVVQVPNNAVILSAAKNPRICSCRCLFSPVPSNKPVILSGGARSRLRVPQSKNPEEPLVSSTAQIFQPKPLHFQTVFRATKSGLSPTHLFRHFAGAHTAWYLHDGTNSLALTRYASSHQNSNIGNASL
jgi:hypothetical protein